MNVLEKMTAVLDTSIVIENQKSAMQDVINTIPNTSNEIEKRIGLLNGLLEGVKTNDLLKEKAYKLLEEDINSALTTTMTETLNVAKDFDDNDLSNFVSKWEEKFEKFKGNIEYREYERVLKKVKKIVDEKRLGDKLNQITDPFLREIRGIYDEMNKWQYFFSEGKNKKGQSIKLKDIMNNEDEFEMLKVILTWGDVLSSVGSNNSSNIIGKIGEYFVAGYFSILNSSTNEILDFKNLFKENKIKLNNGIEVIIAGEEKSHKGFFDNEGNYKNYHSLSKKVIGENAFYHTSNKTDDKVDIRIMIPLEDGKKWNVNASVKNYSDDSSVTILTGNILSILAMYPKFLNHYLNLLHSTNINENNDINEMYRAIKFTVGIHALIGGVEALNQDKNKIITTSKAEYFIYNDNQTGKMKAYKTKVLSGEILSNADKYIELFTKKPNSDYYDIKAKDKILGKNNDTKNQFTNIKVELRLRQLLSSLQI